MKIVYTFFFLILAIVSSSQELPVDANTLLLLHFNNTVNGAAGEIPLNASGLTYAPGRFGQALQCKYSIKI